MHVQTWALHDAVLELARGLGLRSYRVECKLGPEGETVIALVLLPADGPGVRNARLNRRRP
jgi:hypothetical protein